MLSLDNPQPQETDTNSQKTAQLVLESRRLSIRVIAEFTGINQEGVRKILYEIFQLRNPESLTRTMHQPIALYL